MRRSRVQLATSFRKPLVIVLIIGALTIVMSAVSSAPVEKPSTLISPLTATLQCRSNSDCDDGNACNGRESCLLGNCVAGLPPICGRGASCDRTFGCFIASPCNSAVDCPIGDCRSGSCVPTAPCNNNLDCAAGETCSSSGKCVASFTPCTSDSNCRDGRLCDPRTGGCRPACAVNKDCDDGKPCNGLETCNGIRCEPGEPLICNDQDPITTDYCDNDRGGCVYSRPSPCRSTPIFNPTFTADRTVRPIGTTGFTLRGRLNTPFRPNSRIDPARARIQITLTDAYRNTLVNQTIGEKDEGKQWRFDGRNDTWTYTALDQKSGVQKLVITKVKNKTEQFDFQVVGQFADTSVPDLRSLRPLSALIVSWTGDITGPCGAVVTPECGWKTTPAFGEKLFCQGQEFQGPGLP